MNHPEFNPVIVFDDAAFEIGDMVEIKLIIGEYLTGKIHDIEKERFSIDVSEKYHSKIRTYRYSDVTEMKVTDIPR